MMIRIATQLFLSPNLGVETRGEEQEGCSVSDYIQTSNWLQLFNPLVQSVRFKCWISTVREVNKGGGSTLELFKSVACASP